MSIHGLHGLALAIAGDREGAEAEERWLEELDRPGLLGYNTLSRAEIVAHLGRKDESIRLLRQASREGLHYIEIVVDPWLEPLWDYEPYQQLIAPKG
jgi:hypothetical protein